MTHQLLPQEGFIRLSTVLQIIPISKSAWRIGIKLGHFPKPVKLGERSVAWRVEDIQDLIASYNHQPKHDEERRQPYTNKVYNKKPYEQM